MASRDISLERDQIRQYPRSSDEEKTLPNDGPSSTRVDEPPRDMGTVRWVLTCSALYSATLLYGLDTTIVADVQVSIVERFGEISKLTWIGAAFPLGSVAIILPLGVMYESFNYKWLYVSSFILFEAGSALCGGSPNMNALILGRVIAGMGGSGLYLGNLNIFASLTSLKERPMYIAGAGLCWGIGAILGPIVGGAFAKSSATWRWAFYINLVVAAFSGPTYLFSLPSIQPKPGVSSRKKLSQIDFVGTLTLALMWASFIIPLTLAETNGWAWGDATTVACLLMCGVFTAFFILQQSLSLFTAPERRIFPVDLLYNKTVVLLFICTSATSTMLFIPVYYIPIHFQFTRGDGPIKAAIRLLPFVLVGVFTTMTSGAVMPRTGYYVPWYALGGVAGAIGGSVMSTVTATTSAGAIYGYSICIAIGAGSCLQLGYTIAQASLPAAKYPSATRFINMAQLGGTTIALTIAGRLFQSFSFRHVKGVLKGMGFTDQDVAGAIAGASGSLLTSLTPELRERVLEGIVKAITKVYILVIVGAVTTLACSTFMNRERIIRPMSNKSDVEEQKSEL